MSVIVSLEEARNRLSRIGKTPVDVAGELGVSVAIVRGVLGGRYKGTRGDAHKVAVALHLKDGIIIADNASLCEAMQAAAR